MSDSPWIFEAKFLEGQAKDRRSQGAKNWLIDGDMGQLSDWVILSPQTEFLWVSMSFSVMIIIYIMIYNDLQLLYNYCIYNDLYIMIFNDLQWFIVICNDL